VISAAFTDGRALICLIPSTRHNGVYVVRAEPQGMDLIVSHDCPALKYKGTCGHIAEAAAAYQAIQYWEPRKRIIIQQQRIVLEPHWRQGLVPKTATDQIREWIADGNHIA
jgi:hypothetical protein